MKDKEEIRFSSRMLVEQKMGKAEKNLKTARATTRAQNKTKKSETKGKYIIKFDADGVKHMILKSKY